MSFTDRPEPENLRQLLQWWRMLLPRERPSFVKVTDLSTTDYVKKDTYVLPPDSYGKNKEMW